MYLNLPFALFHHLIHSSMRKIVFILLLLFTQLSVAFSQCSSWKDFPGGENNAKTLHVLYRDKFKSKNYNEAYPLWDSLFKFVKLPLPNRFTHFSDGQDMLFQFAKTEKDSLKKSNLTNKLINVYNENLNCNGLNSQTLSWKAYHLLTLGYNVDTVYQILILSFKVGDKKVTPMSLSHLTRVTINFYKSGKPGFDKDFVFTQYKNLKEIVNYNSDKKDSTSYNFYWKDVEANYNTITEVFDCDWFKNKYSKIISDSIGNENILIDVSRIIKNNCGAEDSLYLTLRSKIYEIKKSKILKLENEVLSSDTSTVYRKILACRNLAEYDRVNAQNYEKIELNLYTDLSNSTNEWIDNQTKSNLIYRYAYKLFEGGDYISARYYSRICTKLTPNWGEPYILVGIMYVSSGLRCSPSTNGVGFDAQVCALVAIDEWNMAKKVDPNCTKEVDNLIKNYSKFLPTKSELLQRGISEGSIYKVECWIQQTTKVRGI
jgi:hypothetical protein